MQNKSNIHKNGLLLGLKINTHDNQSDPNKVKNIDPQVKIVEQKRNRRKIKNPAASGRGMERILNAKRSKLREIYP